MSKNEDLHGNAPDKSNVALLIIDMISDFDFEDGEIVLENALPVAKNLAKLKEKAGKANVPVIYVNDNFGKWQSDFKKLLAHCQSETSRGREIADLLAPKEEDYFVLKPKHSAFYSTTLDVLLEYLEVETLILTGIATDICILFTANDAYMRDFYLYIPRDCVATKKEIENEHALKFLEKNLKADTRPSTEIDFEELKKEGEKGK
ncbi:MAG TPA: isochorismatase family cysteine hydrolase [Pyrinomonadaceae bacterium]|nr:isochorismatase family cysteine hydrolase [Pyrinomonadaceae bacterium]